MTQIIIGTTIGLVFSVLLISWYISFRLKARRLNKHTQMIGNDAEKLISKDFSVWAKSRQYVWIDPSLYKYDRNIFFEVDGILITKFAVIVVEIKSISGEITGDARQVQIIKTLHDNEYQITNPVLQNDKHIEHILKFTKTKLPIVSMIVFSDRATLINIKNTPKHVVVCLQRDLFKMLNDMEKSLPLQIDLHNIYNLEKKIRKHQTKKIRDRRKHLGFAKEYKKNNQRKKK